MGRLDLAKGGGGFRSDRQGLGVIHSGRSATTGSLLQGFNTGGNPGSRARARSPGIQRYRLCVERGQKRYRLCVNLLRWRYRLCVDKLAKTQAYPQDAVPIDSSLFEQRRHMCRRWQQHKPMFAFANAER